mmetsp:Transcript_177/g.621  ORF Transcript_177/g.621 Transcript_177/m.621 type:complete len:82 (-) Transcript_177:35-280(-)
MQIPWAEAENWQCLSCLCSRNSGGHAGRWKKSGKNLNMFSLLSSEGECDGFREFVFNSHHRVATNTFLTKGCSKSVCIVRR